MKPALRGLAAALLLMGLHEAGRLFPPAFRAGGFASLLLLMVVLIATASGRMLLRALGVLELSQSERTLIGCTLGLGLLSLGMFALGALGLLRLKPVLILLCALWVLGFAEIRGILASLGANRNLIWERPLWSAAIAFFAALAFWTAWVPPHQYDALVYHLPLPAAYIRAGCLAPVEHLLFSHFPQNGEMLFALALLLGSDILAQLFSWLGAALSLWWVFEVGKRELPLSAVLLACLLTASHTGVMLLSSIAYVETLVMLWVTAAVLCLCRWLESRGSIASGPAREPWDRAGFGGGGRGWLALAAIFAGLGLGTKYYAGICPAVLGLLLALRALRARAASRGGNADGAAGRAVRDLLVFSGLAGLAASPWLLKNAAALGNPVFPFLHDRLPHWGVAWSGESARRYFSVLTEYGHPKGHFLRDLLHFPYLAATGDLRFGGGMDVLGDFGWGTLFVAAPAAVWAAWRNRTLRLVLVYCALHWGAWFCTGVVLRFLIALVPLASLLAAAGLYRLWGALEPRWRAVLACGGVLLLVCNVVVFLYVHTVFSSWNVLLGLEGREQFLARKLEYYPCARDARGVLGKNDRILVVGEQRGYYIEADQVTTSPMAPNPFVAWANLARDPEDLARRLRGEGRFTHILFVPGESRRLGGYGTFAFTRHGAANWAGLAGSHLNPVVEGGSCSLHRIL